MVQVLNGLDNFVVEFNYLSLINMSNLFQELEKIAVFSILNEHKNEIISYLIIF